MLLMTSEIENKLEKAGFRSDFDDWMKAKVIVKYFNPTGNGTWLIIGGEWVKNDWRLFGYVEIGHEWEWGTVMLSELQNYKGLLGLGIERDKFCVGKRVEEMAY